LILQTINAISKAIEGTKGVSLIGVDPGQSTNRTVIFEITQSLKIEFSIRYTPSINFQVYTFVGAPDAVIAAALNAAKVGHKLIDMRNHHGEHPRLGAMDVCPFVPVRNATMEDCAECARKLGKLLADELDIPIYLYGAAAKSDYRRSVPQIRAGEYEGLENKASKDKNYTKMYEFISSQLDSYFLLSDS